MSDRKIIHVLIFWALLLASIFIVAQTGAQAGIREDFKAYEDSRGFVTGTRAPNQASGNSLLFTSEKYLLLTLLHSPPPSPSYHDIGEFGRVTGLCEMESGLYRRTPYPEAFSTDQESQDDYIGLAAASYRLKSHHAGAILTYGKLHFYEWGVFQFPFYYGIGAGSEDPNGWLGRFPALMAHLRWADNENPDFVETVSWSVAVATAGLFEGDAQDPWILSWLMIDTMDGRSWLGRAATQVWVWRFKRAWPGGLGAVFGRYFGDANHPLAVHLQGVFEPSWWAKKETR